MTQNKGSPNEEICPYLTQYRSNKGIFDSRLLDLELSLKCSKVFIFYMKKVRVYHKLWSIMPITSKLCQIFKGAVIDFDYVLDRF